MPPDLIPRIAYCCGANQWNGATWLLLRLAGPGAWALRPDRWRFAVLGLTHEKGCAENVENWRFLFIRSQAGLWQEACLRDVVRPGILDSRKPGQSGYVRGVEDAILWLHELAAAARASGRCMWILLCDLIRAFASTYRKDLLCMLHDISGVRDGSFLLLDSFLGHDSIVVRQGGHSVIIVEEGLPEGGTLGPLTYPLVPDSLARRLSDANCGVGMSFLCPDVWSGRQWNGAGTPVDSWVNELLVGYRLGARLPSFNDLSASPDLEASALRALELADGKRAASLFHADDPIFLSSSRAEMQRMIEIMSAWANEKGAQFHGDNKAKTVCARVCGPGVVGELVSCNTKLTT